MASIAVCIDINNICESALRYACSQANNQQCKLEIVIAIDSSHQNFLFGSKVIANQKRKQVQKNVCTLLEKICGEFNIIPAIAISEGEVIVEIIKAIALINDCKLVVFGKSHSAGSDNSILPKIIRYVGNKIKPPLLVVPNNIDLNF